MGKPKHKPKRPIDFISPFSLYYALAMPLVVTGGWIYWKMETAALVRSLQDTLGYVE